MTGDHAVFKELEARKAAADRPGPPAWARLTADELIHAADVFFSDLLEWGDHVSCERSAFGQVVTWIVRLDGLELGRVRISPDGDQVTKTETMTAIAAGRDPLIMGELLRDLDDHLAQAAGEERKRPHERRRLQFWTTDRAQGERPEPPARGEKLEAFFGWRLQCQEMGYKATLPEIADLKGYSEGYVKNRHSVWRADKDM